MPPLDVFCNFWNGFVQMLSQMLQNGLGKGRSLGDLLINALVVAHCLRHGGSVTLYFCPMHEIFHLADGPWGLERARAVATVCTTNAAAFKMLIHLLQKGTTEEKGRAADALRRMTDKHAASLRASFNLLRQELLRTSFSQNRTRWHLALAMARSASTHMQRFGAAEVLMAMKDDPSNVTRCSVVEGMALLAAQEPSLRRQAIALLRHALRHGSKAEQNRAGYGLKGLGRVNEH